jgi:hypothetical protein
MSVEGVLYCLLNLLLWALIVLFALFILSVIFGWFIPGIPTLAPWNQSPDAGGILSKVYFVVGVFLLINFILCCLGHGQGGFLPPLLTGGRM